MGIKVYGVHAAAGGFGEYDLDVEGQRLEALETAQDYVDHCLAECGCTEDDETEEAADDADGRTRGQDGGVIVALRDQTGHVSLSCVYCED